MRNKLFILLLTILLASCSTTKHVMDDQLLLNKVKIKVENNAVSNDALNEYVSQQPNSNMLFIPKMSLHIYSLSRVDKDKWIDRVLRKIGSAPVIYDESQTDYSERQLKKQMQNLGFLNAEVSHCADTAKKKINITYCIRPNDRYYVRSFNTKIESTEMRLLFRTKKIKKILKIKENAPFESAIFDNISEEVSATFRQMGYYYISKENFFFMADTSVGKHQVDVTMCYRSSMINDSTGFDLALQRLKFNKVTIVNSLDEAFVNHKKTKAEKDTIIYKEITVIDSKQERFIRPSVLYSNNFIRPNRYYSSKLVDNTYSSFNALGAVSQVGVELTPVENDSSLLDAKITLTPSNLYHFQFGVDGTKNAGDYGVASYIGFQQKNIFRGSEIFSIKLNGAFEHITGKSEYDVKRDNYYEYGGDMSLTIPRIMLALLPKKYRQQVGASTVFSVSANWKNRPEYKRFFLSLDWKFNWYSHRRRWAHTFDLYNINFVLTPWSSEWIKRYLDYPGNEMLKLSYQNQFITRSSYSFVYNSRTDNNPHIINWNLRGSFDMAGTLPYLISKIASKKDEDGVYKVFDTPFAQYAKLTFDYSHSFPIAEKCQMIFHSGIGIAVPYGNSKTIPFEQRFFAGGANTVRGWSTRTLGPGAYDSRKEGTFINQVGDIKFIMNLEYRFQTNTFIDLAAFLDAGNVWTLNEKNCPEGNFHWNSFYKQLGFSWGLGIRPNFKFIIVRLDAGMKIHDPAYPESSRWRIAYPRSWGRDSFAFHFGIGYPF